MSSQMFISGRLVLTAAIVLAAAIVFGVIVWLGYSWHGAAQAESEGQREQPSRYPYVGVQPR